MRLGFDYAWATIPPAAIKAAGGSFVCRYLSNDPSKNLSPAEAHELRSNGVDVVVVWETSGTRALAGMAAGEADAHAAEAQAHACGIPAKRPIYFAVDFDEAPPQAPAVASYMQGVANVLGLPRVGAYGGYWAIKRLFDAKRISYGWQTYAWSGGNVDPRAQLYQFSNNHVVAHVQVDYNHAMKTDFGQWGYEPPVPVPPKPAPSPAPDPTKTQEWNLGFQAGFQDGFNVGWRRG